MFGKEYDQELENIAAIGNSLPQLTHEQLKQLKDVRFITSRFDAVFSGVKKNDSVNELITKVCENINAPNSKGVRKMLNNTANAVYLQTLNFAGFTDINCKRTLIENNAINKLSSYENRQFTKALIEAKGEPNASKALTDADAYVLNYTANMWLDTICEHVEPKEYLKGSITEIYNKMKLDVDKYKAIKENRDISYEDSVKSLECSICGFEFRLAKNKKELVNTGSNMSICVGMQSYTDAALNRELIIVLMKKDEKEIACIELTPNMEMVQCKGKANSLLSEEAAEAVRQWAEENNIKTDRCYDFNHMK